MRSHWPIWPPPWVKRHIRHPHGHHVCPVLTIGDLAIDLLPQETIHMATTLTLGQTVPLSISYLDQNGQPMTTAPTPDAPPVWANGDPTVDTLTVAPDGNSATDLAVAAGADTITVNLSVGGKSFSASLAVTVIPPPQVLTSVEIVAGTPTP